MVTIIPYQVSWPHEFEAIATPLRAGLGALALRIDHVGSTAVPGLAAKDVIDVQVTVTALDPPVIAAMAALGYRPAEPLPEAQGETAGLWRDHRPPNATGPDEDWSKLYFRPPPGQRPTNTHVRVQGRPNQRYALLFRDYLRAHPATAAAYAELKRRLGAHMPDSATYAEVKDPAVDLIYLAAEAWAAATGWQPSPPSPAA